MTASVAFGVAALGCTSGALAGRLIARLARRGRPGRQSLVQRGGSSRPRTSVTLGKWGLCWYDLWESRWAFEVTCGNRVVFPPRKLLRRCWCCGWLCMFCGRFRSCGGPAHWCSECKYGACWRCCGCTDCASKKRGAYSEGKRIPHGGPG